MEVVKATLTWSPFLLFKPLFILCWTFLLYMSVKPVVTFSLLTFTSVTLDFSLLAIFKVASSILLFISDSSIATRLFIILSFQNYIFYCSAGPIYRSLAAPRPNIKSRIDAPTNIKSGIVQLLVASCIKPNRVGPTAASRYPID